MPIRDNKKWVSIPVKVVSIVPITNPEYMLQYRCKDNSNKKDGQCSPIKRCAHMSVDVGSIPINTLYNRLLTAGPMRESVRAPFLFADF